MPVLKEREKQVLLKEKFFYRGQIGNKEEDRTDGKSEIEREEEDLMFA